MRYLVTGGAGFIGSHIAASLLGKDGQVRILDDFSTGRRENIAGIADKVEVIEADLRDRAALAEAVRGVDVIFHEAAFVSVAQSMQDPQACFEVNVSATAELMEAARQAGARRLVFASSAAVYGDTDTLPLAEDSALRFLSPYAASKHADEIFGRLYSDALGLEVVGLRYFNVYGPRQRPDSMYAAAVPIFIRQLLDGRPVTIFGDGGQTRDLIHVRDIVRANLIAAEHPLAAGQVLNICTGVETRLLDLLEVLFKLFPGAAAPVFAQPRAGDIYRSVGNPGKAAQLIGFMPEVSLAEGLKETVQWMKA
jgi:UDP-glucose 4-epimerase